MSEFREIDRRTVLQTTGGLLAGTTLLASASAAKEDRVELQVDIKQEAINPKSRGNIPVEVRIPDDNPLAPTDVFFGPENLFKVEGEIGDEICRDCVRETEGLAHPTRIRKVPGDPPIMYMHFPTPDIDFAGADVEDGMITMGVAIIDGIIAPPTFDTVRFVQPRDL